MAVTGNLPELALRSLDASWSRERWEQLPADGNRYEVIDGVLYLTTAPSNFHRSDSHKDRPYEARRQYRR